MSTQVWTTQDMVDMSGKTVLVTGGNGGIGYVSCKASASLARRLQTNISQELLRKNAKVYIGARDSGKSRDAIRQLKEETGKEATLIPLDLSDLRQVRKAAEDFLSITTTIPLLRSQYIPISSGVTTTSIENLTSNSYDLQFGVNVLGHVHLTSLLLPALLASPAPRVINVSSAAHALTLSDGIHFKTLKGPKKATWIPGLGVKQSIQYYGQSKLGNILHATELTRRYGHQGLVAISLHPGLVKTDILREAPSWISRLTHTACISPEQGAITQLFAANAPEAAKLSGKYLVPYGKVETPSAFARDERLARKMWDWCEAELKSF
ncbi:hypothetical protein M408DRAFT_30977 [Serendipita vermifera MAFF 305830]|uniref:NAD(P)-binding protein n=1 Tax=Serendipita vermifera MAFF 305830 TaxID=933852 RepID=A0A0C2VZL4_SERVB|nr:hypothetical protein M408DRAFT_30977 [Serendipita vermifera MAFF 305830]